MGDKHRFIQGSAAYVPEPADLGIVPLSEDVRQSLPTMVLHSATGSPPHTAPSFPQKLTIRRRQPREAGYVPEPADLGIVPLPAEARQNIVRDDLSQQRRADVDHIPQDDHMLVNPPPRDFQQSLVGNDPEPADLGIIPLPEEVREFVRSHSPQHLRERVHNFNSLREGRRTLASPPLESDAGYVPEPAHLGIAPLWGPNPNSDNNPSAPEQEYSDDPPPYEDQHLYRTIT